MSALELTFRIILSVFFPPLGVIGLSDVGCGTFFLLCLLTLLLYVPGLVVSIIIIAGHYKPQK